MLPAALRNRAFARLFWSYLLTELGTGMTFIVLPLVAYERSGSGRVFALVLLGGSIGRLMAIPVGGVLADRFDRRRIMLAGDALMLAVLGCIVLAVTRELWITLAITQFVQNVAGSLTRPAGPALRRDIIDDEHRVQSNALMQLASSSAMLVSPLLGAALYALAGFGVVAALEATALVASLILLFGLRHHATKVSRLDVEPGTGNAIIRSVRATWYDLRLAACATRRDPYLRYSLATAPATGFGNALFMVALVPWLSETLRAPASTVGPLYATLGGSAVVGGLVFARFGHGLRPGRMLLVSGIATSVAPLLWLGTPHLAIVFASFAIVGISDSAWQVAKSTVTQRRVPSHLQGRIPALWLTTHLAANVVGLALAGLAIDRWNPGWSITAAALCWFAALPLDVMIARHADGDGPLMTDHAAMVDADRPSDTDLAVSG